tara:strand:+ start:497 stop:754 length:258 start_codon:yes stop_codon:yes gene_type:complete
MTVKHGKKDYYQILLDPHRSQLLKELVNEQGIKATSLIRELIYEQLEKKVPKHIYQVALAKDKAVWRESISNRLIARKHNKDNSS